MRYVSIELNKHKRLRLNRITRIKLTFEEMIQIFLGTNGSGKSTMMREISMLPAEPNCFEKDGSKIVIAYDDSGVMYTATSIFQPSPRYRMVRHDPDGDVVLNDWGTREAQRKLCEEIFGMTNAIRDMLLGKERFTQMGPGKRREWLMRLNNANYDYALAVYNKFKQEANDLASTLRKTKERLVVESGKVIKPEEEKKLNDEVNQIHRELSLLMDNRAPVAKPSTTFEAQQKQQLTELENLSKQLYRMRFIAPYVQSQETSLWSRTRPSYSSLPEIAARIEGFKSEVAVRDALINKALKEHDRLKEQLDILTKTGEAGLAELHKRFRAIHAKKVEVLATRTLVDVLEGLDSIHPINGMGALESVWDTLQDLSNSIPDNSERLYGQAKIPALTEEMDAAFRVFNVAQNNLERLQAKKTHADKHRDSGETTCPQCSHRWTIGYNANEYERLTKGIEVYEEQVKQAKAVIKDIEERIAKNAEYGEKYRTFIRLTQAWPVLAPLWDYIISNELMVTKARTLMGFVDRFRYDLQIMKDTLRLEAELGEISNLIQSAEKLGDANLTDVRLGMEEWAREVEKLTEERQLLQRDISEYQAYYREMAHGVELGRRIEQLQKSVCITNQEWIETLRRETILHCIRQLQTSLSRKEETLSYVTMQKALVEDMQQQIIQMTVEEEAAQLVVRELSPTEGLIADGLLNFIRYFVGEMNSVIERVWSYPLVIQDCAVESHGGTELDFKFPMVINDNTDDPADDVSDGSTGIMEIVDLAFRISAMRCLGLGNSPLFLDEFGASFDKHHQAAATMTIANIMEERQFSQLFMVSHYEASYGAMSNAEICVLCSSNITIPNDTQYNQHVEIEH